MEPEDDDSPETRTLDWKKVVDADEEKVYENERLTTLDKILQKQKMYEISSEHIDSESFYGIYKGLHTKIDYEAYLKRFDLMRVSLKYYPRYRIQDRITHEFIKLSDDVDENVYLNNSSILNIRELSDEEVNRLMMLRRTLIQKRNSSSSSYGGKRRFRKRTRSSLASKKITTMRRRRTKRNRRLRT